MNWLSVEWIVALRFLREGRAQTALILGGVTLGAAVIVYISALITGLQANIISRTLGTQAHIVVKPAEDEVQTILQHLQTDDAAVISAVQKRAQRLQSITEWQKVYRYLQTVPSITAVSAMVSGAGFAIRGDANKSVAIIGVDAEEYRQIIDMPAKMVAGEYRLGSEDVVIGTELAKDLGAWVGDKMRITTAENHSQVFIIAGIFDLGIKDLNRRWVMIQTHNAQNLLNLAGGASEIDLRVTEIFNADDVANDIAARFGVEADSWMKTNTQLMLGLRSQSASSWMIRVFVTISVAFGIASVLVVSVVQKKREIGIMRAMGISSRSVMIIFLIQGGLVGFIGSIFGLMIGGSWAYLFSHLIKNADGTPVFQVSVSPGLFIGALITATLTGLVAAAVPAFRAAKLDPVVAIRNV
ncbi:MAG TPA: FtsX-like permease family protein [Pseudomonadales bacterium]|nr:FtsX-like permease family protein [Pseudomonadales bacterium]